MLDLWREVDGSGTAVTCGGIWRGQGMVCGGAREVIRIRVYGCMWGSEQELVCEGA